MLSMSLNTNSVCSACGGRVTNIAGRRLTIEQLTAIHHESCAGIRRSTTTRKQDTQ